MVDSRKFVLLFIDDDPELRDLFHEALSQQFNVVTAHGGAEGIAKAKAICPDAIVMDVSMPGMNGIEACKVLRTNEKTSGIPIVMLTALEDDSRRSSALLAGAVDLVSKPIKPRELCIRILRALWRRDRALSAA